MKAKLIKSIRTLLPLLLGGGILYWMYREFDFRSISHVLWNEMDWTWMLLSMPFGILAQALRGWRWYQTLEPLAQAPVSRRSCVSAVYVSYAASLLVPRIGEFTRCALLKRWDGVSFSKAIGTVVTERAVDTLTVLIYSAVILLFQLSVFGSFFRKTGMSFDGILNTRFVTDRTFVSHHSFGTAIDLNAVMQANKNRLENRDLIRTEVQNCLVYNGVREQNGVRYYDFTYSGSYSGTYKNIPETVINYLLYELAFYRAGFGWGYYYPHACDGMHFTPTELSPTSFEEGPYAMRKVFTYIEDMEATPSPEAEPAETDAPEETPAP